MTKLRTLAELQKNHAFIYLDAKKSKNFPYLSSDYEPSIQGFVMEKTNIGVTVHVFTGSQDEIDFYKGFADVEEPSLFIINNLLIEYTQRLFVPWTSIVAIEV